MSTSVALIIAVALLIAFAYAANPSPVTARTRRVMAVGLGVVVIGAFVFHFRSLLPPFVVPLVLAYLLDPVLDRLEREGLSRVKAIGLVYLVLLLFLGLVAVLIIPPVTRQVGELVTSVTSMGGLSADSLEPLTEGQENLRKGIAKTALNLGLKPEWVRQLEDNLSRFDIKPAAVTAGKWVGEQLKRTGAWLAAQISGLLWVLILPVTLFYILRDYDPLRNRLLYLIPQEHRLEVQGLGQSINLALGRYLRGYAVLSLAVGVVQTTVLLVLTPIFGFRYGLFLGLLAGLTYPIPYLGSISAVVLSTLAVYFTGGHNLGHAAITLVIMQVINTIFDSVITPKVVGDSVGIHPLLVMFALLAGGAEFGLLGIILATPVVVCVKIVLEHFFPRLSEPIPAEQTPAAVANLVVPDTLDDEVDDDPSVDDDLLADPAQLPDGKDFST